MIIDSILLVAVVEFDTLTPVFWRETYHWVSMECWKICLFSIILDKFNEFFLSHGCRMWLLITYLTNKFKPTFNFMKNFDFICSTIHSKGNHSRRGVTWNSQIDQSEVSIPFCDISATHRIKDFNSRDYIL